MNANRKIIFIGAGVLLLLLFVFAAVMLFLGIRQFGEAEGKLESARSTLNSFYQKDPFPSRDNVKVVNGNVRSMEQWMTDITDIAKRKQIDPAETRSPSVFANMLGKVKNGLVVNAQQHDVSIDKDFGFGFDAYVEGKPATPDYVPRLMQQLMIINGISKVLISEEVAEINTVEREQFEAGVIAKSVATTGRTTARNTLPGQELRRALSIPEGKPAADTGEFTDDGLDSKMKFVFTFSAKEQSILNIINKLARDEMFIVITSVDIETPEPADPEKESAVTKKKSSAGSVPFGFLPGGQQPAQEQDAEVEGYRPLPSREQRVIYGGKKEKPSRVRMELEVYRFK